MTAPFTWVVNHRRETLALRFLRWKNRLLPNPIDSLNLGRVYAPAYSASEIANNVIFVHVPKAAGRAVSQAIFGRIDSPHTPLKKYRLADPDRYKQSYKFAFIRNPWDRFVSAYFYLKGGGGNPRDAAISTWLIRDLDFSEFLDRCRRSPRFRSRVLAHVHFVPQSAFLDDGAGGTVDEVFRYESLEQSVQRSAEHLGVKARLDKVNASRHLSYQHYFKKQSEIQAIARMYRRDITLFDYRFG